MNRRRLVAAATLALATCSCASGQSTTLGIGGGPVLSAILFDDPYAMDQIDPRVAAHATVTVARPISRVFEVEAGLGIVRTGFVDLGAHYGSVSMDVVRMPVAVRVGLPTRVAPYLKAGLAPSIALACRVKGSVAAESADCDDPLVGTGYRAFDLAGVGGVGMRFPLGAGHALVEIGGSIGLIDLARRPYPPGSARSVAIEMGFAYRIPLRLLFH